MGSPGAVGSRRRCAECVGTDRQREGAAPCDRPEEDRREDTVVLDCPQHQQQPAQPICQGTQGAGATCRGVVVSLERCACAMLWMPYKRCPGSRGAWDARLRCRCKSCSIGFAFSSPWQPIWTGAPETVRARARTCLSRGITTCMQNNGGVESGVPICRAMETPPSSITEGYLRVFVFSGSQVSSALVHSYAIIVPVSLRPPVRHAMSATHHPFQASYLSPHSFQSTKPSRARAFSVPWKLLRLLSRSISSTLRVLGHFCVSSALAHSYAIIMPVSVHPVVRRAARTRFVGFGLRCLQYTIYSKLRIPVHILFTA